MLFRSVSQSRYLLKEAKKVGGDVAQLTELQKQEELAIEQKYNKLLLDETKKLREEQQAELDNLILQEEEAKKSALQKEIEGIQEYYFERITALQTAGQNASGLIAEQAKRGQEVRDKFAQERLAKEREIEDVRLMAQTAGLPEMQAKYELERVELQRQYEDKIALAKKFGEDTTGLEAEYQQKQLDAATAYQQQRINQTLDNASGWLTALSNLNSAFEGKTEEQRKKAFNRNKALQIAQTLIETYKAAQGAYTAQMSIPTPDAPVRAAVAASIAVATGLANVAKIKSQKYDGGSSGGAGGSSSVNAGGLSSSAQGTSSSSTPTARNRGDRNQQGANQTTNNPFLSHTETHPSERIKN